MKKLVYTLALLVSAVAFLTACNEDETENTNGNNNQVTIETTVSNIAQNTAQVELMPSDKNAFYYYNYVESGTLQGLSDEEIIAKAKAEANFGQSMLMGPQTFQLSGLTPNTSYTVVTFAYTNQLAGKVCKAEFTTLSEEEKPITGTSFTLENFTPSYQKATCTVIPDKPEDPYVFYVMEKKWHDEYAAEGENGVIIHAYYGLQNLSVDNGCDNIGQYLKEVALVGKQDLTIDGLKANSEYVLLLFYVDINMTDPTNIQDMSYLSKVFKTLEPTGKNKPTLKVSPVYEVNDDGTITLKVNIKATNTVSAHYNLLDNASAQTYLEQGMTNETMANLFFALDARQIKQMLTPEGLDMQWPPLDPIDYYFVIAVKNEEGACEATGVEILMNND